MLYDTTHNYVCNFMNIQMFRMQLFNPIFESVGSSSIF